MVEFNPRPLFGKHNYLAEEFILGHFFHAVEKGLFWANPRLVNLDSPPFSTVVGLVPVGFRKNRIKDNFQRAKKFLKDLGVD